jgi:hypothetical protein
MKYAKGMRLVSDDVYERLIAGNLRKPDPAVTSQFNRAEGDELYDFTAVLDKPNLGNDDKWKLYQARMHRNLEAKQILEKERPPVKVQFADPPTAGAAGGGVIKAAADTTTTAVDSGGLSEFFTKPQRESAAKIINYLERNGNVAWDGRVLKIDDSVLEGANLIDLVYYLVTKKQPRPASWEQFAEYLHVLNLPKSFVLNKSAQNYIVKLSAEGRAGAAAAGAAAAVATPLAGAAKSARRNLSDELSAASASGGRGGRRNRNRNNGNSSGKAEEKLLTGRGARRKQWKHQKGSGLGRMSASARKQKKKKGGKKGVAAAGRGGKRSGSSSSSRTAAAAAKRKEKVQCCRWKKLV